MKIRFTYVTFACLDLTNVKYACVNFTRRVKFTHAKHINIFAWKDISHDQTMNGSDYICKIFIYIKIYEHLRPETKQFGV